MTAFRRATLALALFSATPALADVINDSEDSAAEEDEEKDGCSTVPTSPVGAVSVVAGIALLSGLRRRR